MMDVIAGREANEPTSTTTLLMILVFMTALVPVVACRDRPARPPTPQKLYNVGINHASWANIGDADTDDLYPRVAETGIGTMRLYVHWETAEPKRGEFNWAPFEPPILKAAKMRLIVEAVLTGPTPCWARKDPDHCDPKDRGAHPADPAYFYEFANAATIKFGAKVRFIALWQEVNDPGQWSKPADGTDDAVEYQRLILIPGYHGVKDAKSRIGVTAPGQLVEPLRDPESFCREVDAYVSDLASSKLTVDLDAITFHTYGTYEEIANRIDCIDRSYGDGGTNTSLCSESGKCPGFWLEEFSASLDGCDYAQDAMATAINVWEHPSPLVSTRLYWQLQQQPGEEGCDCISTILFGGYAAPGSAYRFQPIRHNYCEVRSYVRYKLGKRLTPDDPCYSVGGCGGVRDRPCAFDNVANRLVQRGRFTKKDRDQVLLWHPRNRTYWLGEMTDDQLMFRYVGSSPSRAEDQATFYNGDFDGDGFDEFVFVFAVAGGGSGYIHGAFRNSMLSFSSGPAAAFDLSKGKLLQKFGVTGLLGDFTAAGEKQILFWTLGGGMWLLGRLEGDKITQIAVVGRSGTGIN